MGEWENGRMGEEFSLRFSGSPPLRFSYRMGEWENGRMGEEFSLRFSGSPRLRFSFVLSAAAGAVDLSREGGDALHVGGAGVDAEQVPARGADAAVQRVLAEVSAGCVADSGVLQRWAAIFAGYRGDAAGAG